MLFCSMLICYAICNVRQNKPNCNDWKPVGGQTTICLVCLICRVIWWVCLVDLFGLVGLSCDLLGLLCLFVCRWFALFVCLIDWLFVCLFVGWIVRQNKSKIAMIRNASADKQKGIYRPRTINYRLRTTNLILLSTDKRKGHFISSADKVIN